MTHQSACPRALLRAPRSASCLALCRLHYLVVARNQHIISRPPGNSATMNTPGHRSKASYLPCSTQSASQPSQPGRRRARTQLTKLATTSSCLLLLLCHRQREHLAHGLVAPSHGGVARSTFSRTSGMSGSSASTAGESPRWYGRRPRSKLGLEMTLTSPPPRTQQQQETINGGTQSVREMSAQMSQVRSQAGMGRLILCSRFLLACCCCC